MQGNDPLAQRITQMLHGLPALSVKRMFGGIAFLVNGNLACGTQGGGLVVRVGPQKFAAALAKPDVRPFNLTGRPMAGWVFVEPPGFESDEALNEWVKAGVEFASSLPGKVSPRYI